MEYFIREDGQSIEEMLAAHDSPYHSEEAALEHVSGGLLPTGAKYRIYSRDPDGETIKAVSGWKTVKRRG